MSETPSRSIALNQPALAPLRRADRPSFLVALSEGTIVAVTAACDDLSLLAGARAPEHVMRVARDVASSRLAHARLERVRLPGAFVARLFSCTALHLPTGTVVLFADPAAAADASAHPAPGSSASVPAASVPAELRGDLPQPLRFTWETDAGGRITSLSASARGAFGELWEGRSFLEIEEAGHLLDATPILSALAAGGSFSAVRLRTRPAPGFALELGGVPLLDAARRAIGIRGFGRAEPLPAPVMPAPSAEPPPPESLPPASGAPHGGAPERPSTNVVPLRAGNLSAKERSAFQEIARTLNAAIEDWSKPRPAEAGSGAPAMQAQAPSPPRPPAAEPLVQGGGELALLDRLPLAVVVQQDGATVYANRTFFSWTGLDDLAALAAAGGLSALLDRQADDGPVLLRPASGAPAFPVDVRLVSTPFQGRSGLLHVMRRIDPAPPAPAPGAVATARVAARGEALDCVPAPVLLLAQDGAIRFANAAAVAACGLTADELLDEPFTILLAPPCHADAVRALDAGAVRGASTPLTLRHIAGAESPVAATFGPMGDGGVCLILAARVPEAAADAAAPQEPDAEPALPGIPLANLARRLADGLRGPIADAVALMMAQGHDSQRAALAGALDDLDVLAAPATPAVPTSEDLSALVQASLASLEGAARRRGVTLRRDLAAGIMVPTVPEAAARLVRLALQDGLDATPAGASLVLSLAAEMDTSGTPWVALDLVDGGAPLDEVAISQALDPTRNLGEPDRFALAGRPLRLAALAKLARNAGASLSIHPATAGGLRVTFRWPQEDERPRSPL